MKALNGLHHITLCVGDKQEDYEFHTQILGLRSVKKTLLYDGKVPIYHLYYGNADGDPGSIVTTFPMRHTGIKGKLGNNQIQGVMLAIPPGALDFWAERLSAHGIENTAFERFAEKRLSFKHPTGINYTLVETDAAGRRAWDETNIPADKGIVGMHGITVNVREIELMDEFMKSAWSSELVAEEGATRRYQMGKGGSGTIVGAVIGTLIIATIPSGLSFLRVNPFFQFGVEGVIIIVSVLIYMSRDRFLAGGGNGKS